MNLEQKTRIKIIFLFAIIVLVVLSIISFARIQNLIDESKLVHHTQDVKLELNKVIVNLQKAESSQSGYLLTHNPVFIKALNTATINLKKHLKNTSLITLDNRSQQKNLNILKNSVNKRLEFLQRVLNKNENPSLDNEKLLFGKILMDDILKQIEKIENEEDRLLQIRTSKLNKSVSITPLFAIFLIITSILIIIAAYFKIVEELKVSSSLKKNIIDEQDLRIKIEESELLYRQIFNFSPVAIWEKDDEFLNDELEVLKNKGVTNFRDYLNENPLEINRLVSLVKLTKVNDECIQLLEADSKEQIISNFYKLFVLESLPLLKEAIIGLVEGHKRLVFNSVINSFKGKRLEILFSFDFKIGNSINKSLVTLTDLTADKNSEKALKETENRLHLATETSGVGIWEWNVKTNLIRWDEQMFRIYGAKPTQDGFIEYPFWRNTVAVEEISFQEKILKDTLKNNGTSSRSFKIYRENDGKPRYIESVETARKNAEGQVEWIVGTNMDITDRKVAQEELLKLATHLDLSTRSAGVGTWLLHIHSGKLEWSSLHKTMWGYDEKRIDLGYEDWHKVINLEDKEICFKEVEEAKIEKRKYEVDYRIIRDNNKAQHWIKSVGQYQYNEKGEAITLTGISLDITNNKIAEEKLTESENNFRQLSDLMPEKVSRTDSNGNVIYYNQSWLDYTGYTFEKLKNWGWDKTVDLDDIENLKKLWTQSLKTGNNFEMEFRIINKLGQSRWHLCRSSAIKDENDNIKNWVAVTIDIEQQKKFANELELQVKNRTAELVNLNENLKKSEENLIQINSEQEKLNKELEAFNYISSHDLQEPLRQIQNFASRIIDTEQANLSDKGKNYFERMNNSAQRMQTLIIDLLAYSRTKTAERKFETIDLNQIVNEVIEDLSETIEEKNATVEVHQSTLLKVIPFQFRQMMHNLIGNALKFSKPNVSPHIIVNSKIVKSSDIITQNLLTEKEYFHISISDNGIGFEPQYKNRIFEVFQRLHDKQKIAGTGIGLAIVKKIVENHNGFVTTTSELNNGATFDIYIPNKQVFLNNLT